jgi:hypothetical protein
MLHNRCHRHVGRSDNGTQLISRAPIDNTLRNYCVFMKQRRNGLETRILIASQNSAANNFTSRNSMDQIWCIWSAVGNRKWKQFVRISSEGRAGKAREPSNNRCSFFPLCNKQKVTFLYIAHYSILHDHFEKNKDSNKVIVTPYSPTIEV